MFIAVTYLKQIYYIIKYGINMHEIIELISDSYYNSVQTPALTAVAIDYY